VADTPAKALQNVRQAFLDGDKEAFVECFDTTGKQAEMVDAFGGFVIAARQFDQAMREAYGEEAAAKTTNTGDKNIKNMPFDNDQWLKDVSFQIEGDTAKVIKADRKGHLILLNKGGQWKIDPASMLTEKGATEQGIEHLTAMFQGMTQVVQDASQKVGQPGYSVEKINQEMRQAMMSAMIRAAGGKSIPTP
jgi:hypothetical protein